MTPETGSDAPFRPVTVPGASAAGPVGSVGSTGYAGPSAAGGQSSTQQVAGTAKDKAADVAGTAKDKAADVAGTAKDKAADVAGTAKVAAADVAGTAKDKATDVAGTAKGAAVDVAGTAKEKVADVTGETARQVKQVYGEAKSELSEQAKVQQSRLAEGLRSIGGELSTLARDSSEDGVATQVARRAGETVQQAAGWLEDRDPASVLNEVRAFARRRPGAFIALALGAGVLAGRLTRGLRDAEDTPQAAAPSTTVRPVRTTAVPTAAPAVGTATTPALGAGNTGFVVHAPGDLAGGSR